VLANINDSYVSTHTISQALNMDNAGIKYVWVPNVLKLISAIAVAIISLILIVSTDDLIELLTNFAGLAFISEIDNKLHGMAKNSCLGRSMKESSGGNQPANKYFGRIQVAITLVSFALIWQGFGPFFSLQKITTSMRNIPTVLSRLRTFTSLETTNVMVDY